MRYPASIISASAILPIVDESGAAIYPRCGIWNTTLPSASEIIVAIMIQSSCHIKDNLILIITFTQSMPQEYSIGFTVVLFVVQ